MARCAVAFWLPGVYCGATRFAAGVTIRFRTDFWGRQLREVSVAKASRQGTTLVVPNRVASYEGFSPCSTDGFGERFSRTEVRLRARKIRGG